MAPPSPRRPGFSKRAQYSLFAGYVIAVTGALVALLMVVTARIDPAGHNRLQSFFSDLFMPISRAGRDGIAMMGDGGESISAYFHAASKNKAMAAELRLARQKLVQGATDARELARLKRVLKLIEPEKQIVATARIVSSTGSNSRRFATLAAGSTNGVLNGQPVIGPDGLIGRVVQTGLFSSRILLIIDADAIIPVRRVPDGIAALAIGKGDGTLQLKPLAAGINPFKKGDIFVTSGTGGIYRPGIPVAIGVKHSREGTIGMPIANPASLDFAMVETSFPDAPPELAPEKAK